MPAQDTDHITAHVAGDISGQVALGSAIRQSGHVGAAGAPGVADLDAARAALTALRADVTRDAPADLRERAVERLQELERAVLAEAPDVTTVAYVTRWFARRLPGLDRRLAGTYADPSLARVLDGARSGFAAELRASLGG